MFFAKLLHSPNSSIYNISGWGGFALPASHSGFVILTLLKREGFFFSICKKLSGFEIVFWTEMVWLIGLAIFIWDFVSDEMQKRMNPCHVAHLQYCSAFRISRSSYSNFPTLPEVVRLNKASSIPNHSAEVAFGVISPTYMCIASLCDPVTLSWARNNTENSLFALGGQSRRDSIRWELKDFERVTCSGLESFRAGA